MLLIMVSPRNASSPPDAILIHHEQAHLFEERHAEISGGHIFANTFTFGRSRLMKIFDDWLPAVASPRSLLDVGCGTGHDLLHWKGKGYLCSGVEPAEGMLEIARKLDPGLRIEQATASRLPFADSSFDVVIAVEVLRYLEDAPGSLAEMLRVTKPGGQVIFTATSPISLSLFPLINQISGRMKIPTLTHLLQHFYSVASLRRMLGVAGADLAQVRGAGFVTVFHRIADRILPDGWMDPVYRSSAGLEGPLSRRASLAPFSLHMAIRAVKRG
jgi:ubiquinone/menaquinone biosynthesis C-methylase UbiE